MRENLNQWDYVTACYAIGILMTLALVVWSWTAMKRAETRRDEMRRK